MPTTRGGLAPAQIVQTVPSGPTVNCMFNPTDYTISKSNSYSGGNAVGTDAPDTRFRQGSTRKISLTLWFDTYSDGPNAQDVRGYTDPLWAMLAVDTSQNPPAPSIVEFRWQGITFRSVITNLQQKFTLFDKSGMPLRTQVTIDLEEKIDQTATAPDASALGAMNSLISMSGFNSVMQSVTMSADQTLSSIAAAVTGDAANWRAIAEANNIENPLSIANGLPINVPNIVPTIQNTANQVTNTANTVSNAVSAVSNVFNPPRRP